LSGDAGDSLARFDRVMLQDASGWAQVCDDASRVKPYMDPILRRRDVFLSLLRRLYRAGVLSFTRKSKGRIGAFAVGKKPKYVRGKVIKKQRLVLDCRQVNLQFRAPPLTELGSLAALGEAELPEGHSLFIAGADIKDCFYACSMPRDLWDFFCLEQDVTVDEARWICDGELPRDLEGMANEDWGCAKRRLCCSSALLPKRESMCSQWTKRLNKAAFVHVVCVLPWTNRGEKGFLSTHSPVMSAENTFQATFGACHKQTEAHPPPGDVREK